MTWIMLLWWGFAEPTQIDGFADKLACEAAGTYAIEHMQVCTLEHRHCHYDCIPGGG